MSSRYVFRPALAPGVVTLMLTLLMLWLGFWQLDRAEQKAQLFERFERGLAQQASEIRSGVQIRQLAAEQGPVYTPVLLRGSYEARRQFLLDNQVRDGRVGFEVLTPLRLADGTIVIVNRGWVPAGRSREELPEIQAPAGRVRVRGLLRDFPRPGIRLGASSVAAGGWPRIVNYPTPEDLSALLDEPVAPLMLLLDAQAAHGYLREWRPSVPGPERHFGYAVQWFGLTVALLVIYLVVNIHRREAGGSDE